VVVPDIGDIYRFVAGTGAPKLLTQTTFSEVFLALETLNATPDGLPKPLIFVEYLAIRVRFELASELRRWADRQATRIGLITELQSVRRRFIPNPVPAPQPKSHSCLLMLLQTEGPTGELFRLSYWTQLDVSQGWHPERGLDFVSKLDEVKYRVAELTEDTAAQWAQYEPEIWIEFILSNELLNLAVDQWQWETDSPVPEPVGCRFVVAVRSLERMKSGKWHASWRTRWKELKHQLSDEGTISAESSYRHGTSATTGLHGMTAAFEQNPRLVSLVLDDPPMLGRTGQDQLTVGLRAGIPVIVWHRENCDSEEFTVTAKKLLHDDGPGHVLARARMLRASALAEGPDANHVGNHLTVLWDDPERIIVPLAPASPEEVIRG
jgi:hypothetical protein